MFLRNRAHEKSPLSFLEPVEDFIVIESRARFEFGVHGREAILFEKRFLPREEICSEGEAIARDFDAEGGERGREHVEGAEEAIFHVRFIGIRGV